jgi:hypothetical protein
MNLKRNLNYLERLASLTDGLKRMVVYVSRGIAINLGT